MKKLLKIAKLELGILFFSPIAWLIFIIFLVQTGVTFTELLYAQETQQQLGRPISVLTKVLFAGEKGILAVIQKNLYLYIPLLSMGLFSRELSSGSFKLLLSSPVTVFQIVLGKYLSLMVYCLLLVVVLSSFIITGMFSIENLDIPFILGGILGIYLLMCAYSAVGLFMSSLTSYQVVAAMSTLAILALLNFIGQVGQSYDLIRDITYWFSISGRTDNFINGLLSTKDLIYFLLVILLFLGLTILRFKNQRQSKSTNRKSIEYTSLIIIVVALGYISSLPLWNFYLDSTRFNDRTLTQNSQDLIAKIIEPVEITTYVNAIHSSAGYGSPKNRIKDLNSFETYRRFLPDLKMNYIVYYDTLVQYNDTTKTLSELVKKAVSVHKFDFEKMLTPKQIKEKVNLIPEQNRLVRFVKIGDRQTPLRMFDDFIVYPKEAEITTAIKRIMYQPVTVAVLTNNGERQLNSYSDADYQVIMNSTNTRGSLINSGFEVLTIDASSIETKNPEIVMISDPKNKYSDIEINSINSYIKEGGNIIIAGEPGRSAYLNPILETIGVSFDSGSLLQETENYELDLVQAKFTSSSENIGLKFHDQAIVAFPSSMPVIVKDTMDFNVIPILNTDPSESWVKYGEFDLKTEKISFNPKEDKLILASVAIALERKVRDKQQRIVIIGDADFMSNVEMNRNSPQTVNSSFAIRLFKWLSNGEYPVDVSRPKAIDKVIKLNRNQIQWIKASYMAFLPLLIGSVGAGFLLNRKRN